MALLSKFCPVSVTCKEYFHPHFDPCLHAALILAIHCSYGAMKMHSVLSLLALLMKGKVPTPRDLKGLILRISQSTAFLTCHAFSYSMFLCLLRRMFGGFNVLTASFVPAFLASYVSILVERPSRRGLLSLYVTNVASETLFRMAVWRGLIRPIPNGDIAIFAISIAGLLYTLKSKEKNKDTIFGLLRYVIGPWEEKSSEIGRPIPVNDSEDQETTSKESGVISICYLRFRKCLQFFLNKLRNLQKHRTCPHPYGCVHYVTQGTFKLFSVGYSLQVCLRLLLQLKRIVRNPKLISKCFLHKDAFRFGAFLGGFSGLFRLTMCFLRWLTDNDSASHAIPAGLIAGLSFRFFPDVTIALYILWKWFELMYGDGVEKGCLPRLPGATILLYCTSTAVLFHAALLEPNNLRPSYWKFLHRISGGWIVTMNRKPMDVFGLESSSSLAKVIKDTGTNYLLYPHFG